MRALLVLTTLALAACSGGADGDPCAVTADQGTPTPATAVDLDVKSPSLECSGTSGGVALKCTAPATVSGTKCADGFGLTLAGGNAQVLVRFKGTADGGWSWGAQIAGGDALQGAISVSGLRDPAEPVPTSGMTHMTKFTLNGPNKVEVVGATVSSW